MPRRPAIIRKTDLGRAIDVLHAKGYVLTGVKPDGTVLVDSVERHGSCIPSPPLAAPDDPYCAAAAGVRKNAKAKAKRHG